MSAFFEPTAKKRKDPLPAVCMPLPRKPNAGIDPSTCESRFKLAGHTAIAGEFYFA